jgi:putative mycofactocin binding protein MftB
MPPDPPPETGDADLDRRWVLHPQVSVRPEPFGALLYHFGTRKLSFITSTDLLAALRGLADAPSARVACERAAKAASAVPALLRAMRTLAASAMIRPATDVEAADVREEPA